MNAKELREVIKIHFEKKVPLLIYGHPGIGKSQITRETAEELGVEFIDLRLSLLDPTDLRGFPYVDKEKNITRWSIPEFLPQGNSEKGGILMLDEINLAPPMVQNASYQLILDRRLGEYVLPPNWSIVAAGNLLSKEGYITQIRSALLSRFSVVELEIPTAKDWVMEYGIPRGIDGRIITYLIAHPDKIYEESTLKNSNFPNPRNWEFLSKLIKDVPADSPTFYQLVVSRLGFGVGDDFIAFLKIKIPWEDWLDENKQPQLPDSLDKRCALIAILGSASERKNGLLRLILALEKEDNSELALLGIHFLRKIVPKQELIADKKFQEVIRHFAKLQIFDY